MEGLMIAWCKHEQIDDEQTNWPKIDRWLVEWMDDDGSAQGWMDWWMHKLIDYGYLWIHAITNGCVFNWW